MQAEVPGVPKEDIPSRSMAVWSLCARRGAPAQPQKTEGEEGACVQTASYGGVAQPSCPPILDAAWVQGNGTTTGIPYRPLCPRVNDTSRRLEHRVSASFVRPVAGASAPAAVALGRLARRRRWRGAAACLRQPRSGVWPVGVAVMLRLRSPHIQAVGHWQPTATSDLECSTQRACWRRPSRSLRCMQDCDLPACTMASKRWGCACAARHGIPVPTRQKGL